MEAQTYASIVEGQDDFFFCSFDGLLKNDLLLLSLQKDARSSLKLLRTCHLWHPAILKAVAG